MNNMQIKNKDLAIYLGFKLNKIGNVFSEEELKELKELNLNQLDGFGDYQEIDIEVLDYASNLETLVLRNFEINDEIINKLKKMNNLKSISLDSCLIDDFNKIGELDLDYLSITNNRFLTTDFLKGKQYRGLIITDSDLIDINNIKDMAELEFLHISNSHVTNSEQIKNLKNLNIVHIEHSDIKDISFLQELPNLKTVGIDKEMYNNNTKTVVELENRNVEFLEDGLVPINEDNNKIK